MNVRYTESGVAADFYYVPGPADCALSPAAGWHFDDAANPTRVVLCPDTCTRVTASAAAAIDIDYGCERREVTR